MFGCRYSNSIKRLEVKSDKIMRPIYINRQNVKGRILLIGVEFAHMCASILFRPDDGTWTDLRIEAKDISVNGQKYNGQDAIALQERESMT